MIENILELALNNGLWAVLFVLLFFYQLSDSKKRERKYISLINQLATDVTIIKKVDKQLSVVSGNVLEIKKMILKRGGKVSEV